jgi:formiminotetrahydrofolate cyclodeaminase
MSVFHRLEPVPYDRLTVAELLDALGERTPSPASGAAIAVTGALAAATAELAARFADDDGAVERAQGLRNRFIVLADDDADAYQAFMADRSDENRSRTVEVPLAMAEAGLEVVRLGRGLEGRLSRAVAGDAAAAAILARSVVAAACRLVSINAREGDERVERAERLAADAGAR